MRKFVRHPSSIPIELAVERVSNPRTPELCNISNGGFACAVDEPIPVGAAIQLRIPMIWPDYRGCGVVVWCHPTPPRYEVGIEFRMQDLFKTKMIEQLCQIEHYRRQVMSDEGRDLDGEQAAQEWIALYARDFSESFGASSLR
ncbi:MAG TPA: PilZ domain-containing protein [Spongiibacteraceae bacterium]|nr:PilZ domain-containing protein [Spongiibacteraceae bacterium]